MQHIWELMYKDIIMICLHHGTNTKLDKGMCLYSSGIYIVLQYVPLIGRNLYETVCSSGSIL